jgi:hypothetical protein
VNLCLADQLPKIPRILGYDDPILRKAPRENPVIRLTPPTHMQRMHGIVAARFIEPGRKQRR